MPFVGGLPKMLRGSVQHLGIERRKDDWERPLPALFQRPGRLSREKQRIHLYVAGVSGMAIEARQKSALAAGVKEVGIARVGRDVAALAAGHRVLDFVGSLQALHAAAAR